MSFAVTGFPSFHLNASESLIVAVFAFSSHSNFSAPESLNSMLSPAFAEPYIVGPIIVQSKLSSCNAILNIPLKGESVGIPTLKVPPLIASPSFSIITPPPICSPTMLPLFSSFAFLPVLDSCLEPESDDFPLSLLDFPHPVSTNANTKKIANNDLNFFFIIFPPYPFLCFASEALLNAWPI